jgi:penicillin amidase
MDFWQWGKVHTLRLNHALGRVKILQPLLAIGPWPSPGDGLTLNLGFYRHSNPYAQTVGASLRFILDLGRWEHSGFVLPSGQSGHPFSPYFCDQTELWRKTENIHIDLPETHTKWEHCLLLQPTRTPAP